MERSENPALEFYADGVLVETRQTGPDFQHLTVTVPSRPDRRGVVIAIRASKTLIPGSDDKRELGAMFDRLELTPAAVVFPPRSALGNIAVATGALGAALALIGLSLMASVGGGGDRSRDIGRGRDRVRPLYRPALCGDDAVALGWRRHGCRRLGHRVALGRCVKADGAVRDRLFSLCGVSEAAHASAPEHARGRRAVSRAPHRTVVEGNLFFTSLAPGNYQFPYAPGLYVAASPFVEMVSREAGT